MPDFWAGAFYQAESMPLWKILSLSGPPVVRA